MCDARPFPDANLWTQSSRDELSHAANRRIFLGRAASTLKLGVDLAHFRVVISLRALFAFFRLRGAFEAGSVSLPQREHHVGILLRLDHDLGKSFSLLEHREHARSELAARF